MTSKGRAAEEEAEGETMTFEQAMERYDGEWLVLRIVSEDVLCHPETVQVAARAGNRGDAYEAFARLKAEEPVATFWVWEAMARIDTGEKMRRTLAQASEFYEGDPFVWPR